MAELEIGHVATADNASADHLNVYPKSDNKVYTKNAAGAEERFAYASELGSSGSPDQLVYVGKNGNDSTGSGTIQNPYLTIKAAMAAITDATTAKRYTIIVTPGQYAEANPITCKEYVDIVGTSQNACTVTPTTTTSNLFETIGNINISNISISSVTSAAAIRITGTGTITIYHSNFSLCLYGLSINSSASIAAITTNACFFLLCTTAIHSEGKESIFLSISQAVQCTTDISIADSDALCVLDISTIDREKVSLPNGYDKIRGLSMDLKTGDEVVHSYSEFSVGRPEAGKESVFGEGDSYTRGMLVYTYNASTTAYSNVTSDVQTPGDSNTISFPATAADNAIYFTTTLLDSSSNKIIMSGIKTLLTVNLAVGSGSVIHEYWNGAAWSEVHHMGVTASGNYLTAGENYLENVNSYQVRFDDRLIQNAALNDPMGLGVTYYWVRIRVVTAITTSPSWDQIKIHCNRTELNQDGFLEYFGKARPIKSLQIGYGAFQAANNSPANVDNYLSDTLAMGMIENSFLNSAIDKTGFNFYVPLDIDTSCPIRFRITYYGTIDGTDTIDWTVSWAHSTDGDTCYTGVIGAPTTAAGEQSIERSTAAPATEGQMKSEIFELNISGAVFERSSANSGDLIWIAITRTGTADAYAGNINIVNIIPFYTAWRDGGHINNWS